MPCINSDSPIRAPDQDQYGIDPFARTIARSIRDSDSRDGLVYAVNGAWGSGKSSAINLVLHHLAEPIENKEIVATSFNPWWFSGAEALTISFFQELQATIGTSAGEETRKLIASFGASLSSAGPLLGGLASLLATPAAGAAISGAASAIGTFTHRDSTVEAEYRRVVEALARQSKKFLIVLDDIDRLNTDDALQIFKLVKSVGRLPKVIYLMAFDRALAEKMVSERFPAEGSSYLEKVVQVAFDVPAFDQEDLRVQLLATVSEVMGAPPDEKMHRLGNIFHDCVKPFLETPRDNVRLGNAIRACWPSICGDADRADFLAIEAMRLFLPSTYSAVRDHPEMLTGRQPEHNRGAQNLEEEYNALFLNQLDTAREREIAKRALSRLFPRLEAVWRNTWYSDSVRWRRDRLICAPEHFQTYFMFGVTNGRLSMSESDSFVANAGIAGATANALRRMLATPRRRGGTRAALALEELSVRASDISAADLEQFLKDLFSVADELNVPADCDRSFLGIASNEYRLHWLLNNLLLDRLELAARSQILRTAAPAASLAWLVQLSDRCKTAREKVEEGSGSNGQSLADDDTADWLVALSLDRVREAASNGLLVQVPDLIYLLHRWGKRASDQEVRAWTAHQLDDDTFVVRLATDLVHESSAIAVGDRVARRTTYVHLQSIEPLLDTARLRERIGTLVESTSLTPDDRAALERFRATREGDPAASSCSTDPD